MQLYIEGYLQAMLDTIYKQEYLRVRVIENQVLYWECPDYYAIITIYILLKMVFHHPGDYYSVS